MKKFLLICSAMVSLYGNDGLASRYVDSDANQNRNSDIDSAEVDSEMGGRNRNDVIGASEADDAAYSQAFQRMRERVEQAVAEGGRAQKRQHREDGEERAIDAPQMSRDDRVITSFSTIKRDHEGKYSISDLPNYLSYHRLFCYRLMRNGIYVGSAVPTIIAAIDDPNIWGNIVNISYAVATIPNATFWPRGAGFGIGSVAALTTPKVTLTRKVDNSCSIEFALGRRCTIRGLNERHVKIGDDSFAVYDIEAGSSAFTDDLPRLAYVDKTGLYIVPARENALERIADVYQREGEFRFNGSVIQVSAMDGNITIGGRQITEDNFRTPLL